MSKYIDSLIKVLGIKGKPLCELDFKLKDTYFSCAGIHCKNCLLDDLMNNEYKLDTIKLIEK